MGKTKAERDFQSDFIQELKSIFPGCILMKNDSSYIQGIPDWTMLHNNKWCSLELKRSKDAVKQPNQEYYVGVMNEMSFSRFVYPENKDVIIDELKEFFNERRNNHDI